MNVDGVNKSNIRPITEEQLEALHFIRNPLVDNLVLMSTELLGQPCAAIATVSVNMESGGYKIRPVAVLLAGSDLFDFMADPQSALGAIDVTADDPTTDNLVNNLGCELADDSGTAAND